MTRLAACSRAAAHFSAMLRGAEVKASGIGPPAHPPGRQGGRRAAKLRILRDSGPGNEHKSDYRTLGRGCFRASDQRGACPSRPTPEEQRMTRAGNRWRQNEGIERPPLSRPRRLRRLRRPPPIQLGHRRSTGRAFGRFPGTLPFGETSCIGLPAASPAVDRAARAAT